jgi:hypothetical protein
MENGGDCHGTDDYLYAIPTGNQGRAAALCGMYAVMGCGLANHVTTTLQ